MEPIYHDVVERIWSSKKDTCQHYRLLIGTLVGAYAGNEELIQRPNADKMRILYAHVLNAFINELLDVKGTLRLAQEAASEQETADSAHS